MTFTNLTVTSSGDFITTNGQLGTGWVSITPVQRSNGGYLIVEATKSISISGGRVNSTVSWGIDLTGLKFLVRENVIPALNPQPYIVDQISGSIDLYTASRGFMREPDESGSGSTGPQGAAGATGAQGIKGDTGLTGPVGSVGATGAQGPTGSTGSTGSQGPKGDTGDTGAQGSSGSVGPQGATGSAGATGAAGPSVTRATWSSLTTANAVLATGTMAYETDTGVIKVGDGSSAYNALPYARDPNVWTPASVGLIAATGDGATMPSQAAVTAGRLLLVPVRVDQSGTVNGIITAYISATATTTDTNTFIGVYDVASGSLLGQTADLASFLTTVGGALVVKPLVSPITGLKPGQQIYLALLNNYLISTGPQWVATRLFGTAMTGVTGLITRLYVSSGTFSALPASVPTIAASGTNSIPWIGLTQ